MFDVIARNKVARTTVVVFAAACSRFAVMAWLGDRELGNDIRSFRVVAETLLAGKSVFDLPHFVYTYPPVWMYAAKLLRSIGDTYGVSFTLLIKLPQVFADCLVSALVVFAVARRTEKLNAPMLAGLLYALNPLSIYVAAGIGQIDPLVMGLVLVAMLLAEGGRLRGYLVGGLVLGIAISLKTFPILLAPWLVWRAWTAFPRRWVAGGVAGLCILPWALALLPFLLNGETTALTRTVEFMFLQSGSGGLAQQRGLLSALAFVGIPIRGLNAGTESFALALGVVGPALAWVMDQYRLLLISKILFVTIYLVMFWFLRNGPLLKVCLLTFVILFSVIGGFFGYYLLWPLPFAVVLRDKGVVPYSLLAFVLNVWADPWVNLLFWVFCVGWSVLLVRGLLAEQRSAVEPHRAI